jgi:hypothetical protein
MIDKLKKLNLNIRIINANNVKCIDDILMDDFWVVVFIFFIVCNNFILSTFSLIIVILYRTTGICTSLWQSTRAIACFLLSFNNLEQSSKKKIIESSSIRFNSSIDIAEIKSLYKKNLI